MPYSAGENLDYVARWLRENNPRSVIDVGPGSGTYGRLVKRQIKAKTIAVEVFEPYVSQFGLHSIYDEVHVMDARDFGPYDADLVIAGDVMEHLTEEDMVTLVNRMRSEAKYLIVSVPIVHYPQGESHGNHHECHLQEDLNTEKIFDLLGTPDAHIEFDVTGTYVYRGI